MATEKEKEKLIELLNDPEVVLLVLEIVSKQLGDLVGVREFLDENIDR